MQRGQQVFQETYDDCELVSDDDVCETGVRLVRRPAQYADNAQLPPAFFTTSGDLIYSGLRYGFRGEQFGAPEPAAANASLSELVHGVQQLLNTMVDHGYALGASVQVVSNAGAQSSVTQDAGAVQRMAVPAAADGSPQPATSATASPAHVGHQSQHNVRNGSLPGPTLIGQTQAAAAVSRQAAVGSSSSFRVTMQGPANLWGLGALGARRSLVTNAFDAMVIDAWLRASGRSATHTVRTTDTGFVEDWTLLRDRLAST